jgi:hypothetical protein
MREPTGGQTIAETGETTSHHADGRAREQGHGRPSGIPEDARKDAEGRPTVVRRAQPETPPVQTQPTEGAVDRGQTPDTELDPGQDL